MAATTGYHTKCARFIDSTPMRSYCTKSLILLYLLSCSYVTNASGFSTLVPQSSYTFLLSCILWLQTSQLPLRRRRVLTGEDKNVFGLPRQREGCAGRTSGAWRGEIVRQQLGR